MRFAVSYWSPADDISTALTDELTSLGHDVVPFHPADTLDQTVDHVIVHGPEGSLRHLGHQLLTMPRHRRPTLLVWYHEGLPSRQTPNRAVIAISSLRSYLGDDFAPLEPLIGTRLSGAVRRLGRGRMARLQYFGDMRWMHQQGVLDTLAVTSDFACQALRRSGLPVLAIHFGAPAAWGADLHLKRDIPTLWIGNPATPRRKRLLSRVRGDLARKGIPLLLIDGHEHPAVFGEERTALLNRTKIVLNFTRAAWDNNTQRHVLAMLNRALVISEPMPRHVPFEPGVHYVEVAVEQMAATVEHFLKNPGQREQMTARAHAFVTEHLTFGSSVRRIVEACARARETRGGTASLRPPGVMPSDRTAAVP